MTQPNIRMIQLDPPPNDSELRAWMGDKAHKYWQQITGLKVVEDVLRLLAIKRNLTIVQRFA